METRDFIPNTNDETVALRKTLESSAIVELSHQSDWEA